MKTGTKILIGIVGVAVLYEMTINGIELWERFHYWNWAKKYCDSVGKPLLRIGMHRGPFEPPNGDVTLDVDPAINSIPGGVEGDERFMSFKDNEFGVCFNEHTLEHLHSPEDVDMAVRECCRVADYSVLLAPSPYSIYASLFCPSHRLRIWLDQDTNSYHAVPNEYITGFGKHYSGDTGGEVLPSAGIGQHLIVPHDSVWPRKK